MSYIYAMVLGIVQGLTEFLPVSSSGHLVLLNRIFNISEEFLFTTIVLHIATLFAIIAIYYKKIWELIKHPFSTKAVLLYLSIIPTILLVFVFKTFLEKSYSGNLLALFFLITALLLALVQIFAKRNNKAPINSKTALLMGFAQGIAVFPGISRSGSTISVGLLCGKDKEEVASFSFIMSIPVIIGSMLYEIIFHSAQIAAVDILPTLIAFLFAFLFGILSIKIMLKVIKKANYFYFSGYLLLLSMFIFAFQL